MELPKIYDPTGVEDKWYAYWLSQGYFHSEPNPDKKPYTIVIPPPNVTGVLHMGHMLNNTVQDVLVRRARMLGMEACWVPGTDHASIATEAKVVQLLREKGITKASLGREEFLKHAWDWKEKYGGIILEQLKKLGASCDWERTRFTMEPSMSEAVSEVFVRLYEKGLVYRGYRMVNWDPVARTSVSDEEVIYKEEQGKLWYVRYPFVGREGYMMVATTRPETILADVAIAVNPTDERYKDIIGQLVEVPLSGGRQIPIMADEAILVDFGTGALKVTPAHDALDYEIGQRNNLETIDMLNEDGTINEHGGAYAGMDRFAARKKFAKDLEAAGLLERAEDYTNKVGRSERTDAVIEPRLSLQWFVKMKELAGPALEAVTSGRVKLHPEKYQNTYRHWMENVHDWCISRQLWWGQRIPAFYMLDGTVIVAKNAKEALRKARNEFQLYALSERDLRQDEDVVDTWFSSWLWPLSVFDHFEKPGNPDISYYYPTNTLVTAPEILFFWVARMVMAGLEFHGEIPFTDVYLTGIVRDKLGRKMSKQLGNSPDPLDLIAKFGADAVRFGMLVSSPAGNDLLYDEKYIEQGRNFTNKIWNALRLIKGWEVKSGGAEQPVAVAWFRNRMQEALVEIEEHFERFRISDAQGAVYKLIWDDFCSWYLEMVKPPYGEPIGPETLKATEEFLAQLMVVLHPFMPFITEEVWQTLRSGESGKSKLESESICVAEWPKMQAIDEELSKESRIALEAIAKLRGIRAQRNIPMKQGLKVQVSAQKQGSYSRFEGAIKKLAGIESLEYNGQDPKGPSEMALVGKDKFFVLLEGQVDAAEEKASIDKELEYLRGFLQSVQAKLSNERFVANAKPDLVERERAKRADAEAKILALEEKVKGL